MNIAVNKLENNIKTAINIGHKLRKTIADHSHGQMSHREYQILEFIIGEYLAHRQMVMEQGMSLRHLGSRYTLRKAIKTLIDQGFVAIQESQDSRLRPLVPTDQALDLFASISSCISSLVAQSPTNAASL
ncbi:MAG: hypothetical protein QF872_02005 [Gammaproteobacteria bacterium]|nr:hypothetical protein [Gammaproteobacteria bacterium]